MCRERRRLSNKETGRPLNWAVDAAPNGMCSRAVTGYPEQRLNCLNGGSMALHVAAPYTRAERLADAKPDADRDADDEQADQDLNNDSISLAEVGEAVAVVSLHLGGLCLFAPVVLARPDLAVGAASGAVRRFPDARLRSGDDGFDVGVKGVGVRARGG